MTASWIGPEGLRFSCTRCGRCCTGAPGYVWLGPGEAERIAEYLGQSAERFRRRFTRLVGRMVSLTERPDGDCVFLDPEGGCRIQPVKPRQCLTFPFWGRLLAERRSWEQTARRCPGIGSGRRYTPAEIDLLEDRGTPRELLWKLMGHADARS